jgi:hypothetical protein
MGSGRKTIEPRNKAHKPADSGVVVGKGARMRSLVGGVGKGCRRGDFWRFGWGGLCWDRVVFFASRLAPTGFCVAHGIYEHHRKSVGVGLLAKALAHSALMQADPPYSRASSLPQGFVWCTVFMNITEKVWERACSR